MRPSDSDARQTYNAMGKQYQDGYGENPNQVDFVRQSLQRLSITPSTKVLDIGQGTGRPTSDMIVGAGCKVFGIDVSEEMTRIAREQIPSGQFTSVSMLEYEPPFQFDAAFTIFTTFDMQLSEVEAVVPKWADWIKPGGWLFIGTITGEDWSLENVGFQPFSGTDTEAGIAEPKHMGKRVRTLNITKKGWVRLLESAGFEIVEDVVQPFQPPPEYDTDREPHYYITCRKKWMES